MRQKIEHFTLEMLTWASLIGITLFVVFLFPWYVAENILRYLLMIASVLAILWYLKSRRLFAESDIKTKEILDKQRQISRQQKTFDIIFNNAADGILILDESQKIESFSPGMEMITGYKKEDMLGRSAQQTLKFKGDNENSLLTDAMFLPKNIRKKPYIKNTLLTKEGREIDIEASYSLIQDAVTQKPKGLAIIRDVTYENELMRRDKEFIAITSHQLNTPLSIIRGYVSLLREGKAGKISEIGQKYLDETYDSVKKMISLTNNLLSISRIEQEKIKLEKEDVNIKELFTRIEQAFGSAAKTKKIALDIDPKVDHLVYCDGEKIFQALSNIVDNSIKYTKEGSVKLSAHVSGGNLEIKITDTGVGIPEESIGMIGDKFYRTQEAINIDNKGTGLGMFISKTIIEKHNGKLSISSKLGKGSEFLIILPVK